MSGFTKVLLWFVGLFVVIAIITLAVRLLSGERKSDTVVEEPVVEVNIHDSFRETMLEKATAKLGRPMEGFTADLLVEAFRGLVPQDFDGVETLEGQYEYDGEKLEFHRNESGSISSAERTLSPEGYETLLQNIGDRLSIDIDDENALSRIWAEIDTDKSEARIERVVGMNGIAEAFGVQVNPIGIMEESRCPLDASCVQAGTVRLRTEMSDELGDSTQIFTLGETITTENIAVTLTEVRPLPYQDAPINLSDYKFTFTFERRAALP